MRFLRFFGKKKYEYPYPTLSKPETRPAGEGPPRHVSATELLGAIAGRTPSVRSAQAEYGPLIAASKADRGELRVARVVDPSDPSALAAAMIR